MVLISSYLHTALVMINDHENKKGATTRRWSNMKSFKSLNAKVVLNKTCKMIFWNQLFSLFPLLDHAQECCGLFGPSKTLSPGIN